MSEKQEFTPINPKAAMRKLAELLPPLKRDEGWIPQLVQNIFLFSNTFLVAEVVERGIIDFEAEASYDQLATVMGCARVTAEWRVKELAKRHPGVLTHKRGRYSNHFLVKLRNSGGTRGIPGEESSHITEPIESHNEILQSHNTVVESHNEEGQSHNQLCTLSSSVFDLSSLSRERFVAPPAETEHADSLRSNNKSNPTPTPTATSSGTSPRSPAGTSRPGTHGTQGKTVASLHTTVVPPRRSQAELDRILEARRRAVHRGRHFHVEDDDHSELDE
jgi:hypothetical protein